MSKTSDSSSDSSAIIGGVVGGVVLLLMITVVLCIVILCMRRCHRKGKYPQVPATTNYVPYSATSEDECNYVQPNQQSHVEENKRNTNPDTGEDRVDTGEDRVTTFTTTTTIDTKAHQSSHDDTTEEYDYARGHHGHLLHHNTAANTTGDAKKDYTQSPISVDLSHYCNMQNVHPLCIANSDQLTNEGEYGVVNQPKSDYVDYETTGDAKGQIYAADDQSYNTTSSAKPDGEGEAT